MRPRNEGNLADGASGEVCPGAGPTNLNPQQQACRLRRLNICATNQLIPFGRALACYCYAEELAHEEGLHRLEEAARLNRALALEHFERLVQAHHDLEDNEQES